MSARHRTHLRAAALAARDVVERVAEEALLPLGFVIEPLGFHQVEDCAVG
jgi:hypothetical protein